MLSLVGLTDAVADALQRPFKDVSLEMVFRGLYHFAQAHHRGEADDPVAYFARRGQSLVAHQTETEAQTSIFNPANGLVNSKIA